MHILNTSSVVLLKAGAKLATNNISIKHKYNFELAILVSNLVILLQLYFTRPLFCSLQGVFSEVFTRHLLDGTTDED